MIDSVMPDNAAFLGGMQAGDSVVAVDGVPTPCAVQVTDELQKHPCDSITLDFYRNGEPMSARLFIGDQCRLGVYQKSKYAFFKVEHTDYSFFESIPAGIEYGWDLLAMYVKQFRLVFSKEGAQSWGGFGTIGSKFPT